jgi:hypothetical protein
MNQADRQKKIREIQASTMPANEKSVLIRNLLTNPSADSKTIVALESNISLSCSHYNKICSRFLFQCCQVIDPCHRCHQERGCSIGQPCIQEIECNQCAKRQLPSPTCIECNTTFSSSYCNICMIWTSATIHHCHDCGICRVGTSETLYHCPTCDICFLRADMERHVCMKRKIRGEKCPFCLEHLFSSQQGSIVMKCGHSSHIPCLESAISSKIICCPLCRKSMCDLSSRWKFLRETIARNPMPRDWPLKKGHRLLSGFGSFIVSDTSRSSSQIYEGYLVDWKLANGLHPKAVLHRSTFLSRSVEVKIFCNDCEYTDYSNHHEFGLECTHCGSFNTVAK